MNAELKTTIIGRDLIEMLSRNFHGVTEQNPDLVISGYSALRPRLKSHMNLPAELDSFKGYFPHDPTSIFKISKSLSILLSFVSSWAKHRQS